VKLLENSRSHAADSKDWVLEPMTVALAQMTPIVVKCSIPFSGVHLGFPRQVFDASELPQALE
jgi:hypothetical protein